MESVKISKVKVMSVFANLDGKDLLVINANPIVSVQTKDQMLASCRMNVTVIQT